MLGDVAFELLPVLIIPTYALAVGADRKQASELLHVRQGRLQLRDAIGETFLQRQNADAYLHARAKLFGVERLRDVVVRARVEPRDQITVALPRREEDE